MTSKFKFMALGAIAAIGCAAGICFASSDNGDKQSALTLINVEALTHEEKGKACYSSGNYDSSKPEVLVCGRPCKFEPRSLGWFASISYCDK